MFALADPTTTRLLRALSTEGPATVREAAVRLALPPALVRAVLCQSVALGVVRPAEIGAGRYEVVPSAVEAAVAQHRDALLGASA